MSTTAKVLQRAATTAPLALAPLNATSLRTQVYGLLKAAIADTDIYNPQQELRLDERQLITALGVSRTPIREALSLLEQEGFIRTVPRRGIFIVRKSKREIIEMIQMWAALESMAARLATLHAPDAEIATLRQNDRASRSIIDHLKITEALERRDTELAERLARQHTLGLAAHVDRNCDFLG